MTSPALLNTLTTAFLIVCGGQANAQVFSLVQEIEVPAVGDAESPSLVALPDGRIVMTWAELDGPVNAAVRIAIRVGDSWTEPVTVAKGEDLFVNYADFPSAAVLADGTLAVHWLQMNAATSYAYDTHIALSHDDGVTWGKDTIPHRDGTPEQHGFVSMVADRSGGIMTMWLDGRASDASFTQGATEDAMQLRATRLTSDGTLSDDILLDDKTCSCCQTTAVALDDWTILLAYRDRSNDEIRDISLVRWTDGNWSDPVAVSNDGWEISGCPVNGPAIDANGDNVALVWFTGVNNKPAVRMAFSEDRGASFGAHIGIDLGMPVGGVDVLQMADGTALVSWVENSALGEALWICRATPQNGCGVPMALTIVRDGRTIGFPRMVASGNDVWVAWNEPSRDGEGLPDGAMTIRAVHATIESRR